MSAKNHSELLPIFFPYSLPGQQEFMAILPFEYLSRPSSNNKNEGIQRDCVPQMFTGSTFRIAIFFSLAKGGKIIPRMRALVLRMLSSTRTHTHTVSKNNLARR